VNPCCHTGLAVNLAVCRGTLNREAGLVLANSVKGEGMGGTVAAIPSRSVGMRRRG